MKRFKIYFLAFVVLTSTSCKKFLEQSPDNRTQLSSVDKVAQLLGTAYPQYNCINICESMSDNVADRGSAYSDDNINAAMYRFQDIADDQQDSPQGFWSESYKAIAAANQALKACEQNSSNPAYAPYKGEALLARAYNHFMLVTLFSKTYDAATAATDAGVPYVIEPEEVVFKKYDRKTVAYVYQQIEKDLLEGLPLIKDQSYTVPKYHFNKQAANAFAARFYLFKKDYKKVIQYANAVLPGDNFKENLRQWNTDEYQLLGYEALWDKYQRATEPTNLLLSGTVSTWWITSLYARFGLSTALRNQMFSAANITGGAWSFKLFSIGGTHHMIPKNKDYFVPSSINANIGLYRLSAPLLTLEEVLFNRAEAYVYDGNTAAAIKDLNTYASTRITNYNPATRNITESKLTTFYAPSNLQDALIKCILEFKKREFVQEGLRWFDVLRYKIPVTHTTTTGDEYTLTENDLRRVIQIPSSATLSGIAQNPR